MSALGRVTTPHGTQAGKTSAMSVTATSQISTASLDHVLLIAKKEKETFLG